MDGVAPEKIAASFIKTYSECMHRSAESVAELYDFEGCFSFGVEKNQSRTAAGQEEIVNAINELELIGLKLVVSDMYASYLATDSMLIVVQGFCSKKSDLQFQRYTQTCILHGDLQHGFVIKSDVFRLIDSSISAEGLLASGKKAELGKNFPGNSDSLPSNSDVESKVSHKEEKDVPSFTDSGTGALENVTSASSVSESDSSSTLPKSDALVSNVHRTQPLPVSEVIENRVASTAEKSGRRARRHEVSNHRATDPKLDSGNSVSSSSEDTEISTSSSEKPKNRSYADVAGSNSNSSAPQVAKQVKKPGPVRNERAENAKSTNEDAKVREKSSEKSQSSFEKRGLGNEDRGYSNQIYVGLLPAEWTDEQIISTFSSYGEVAAVHERKSRSDFCFVEFKDDASVSRLLNDMNEKVKIGPVSLRVSRRERRSKENRNGGNRSHRPRKERDHDQGGAENGERGQSNRNEFRRPRGAFRDSNPRRERPFVQRSE